jgi:hypothetical protein
LQACVDEFERLWQFVQVNAWVSDKRPVIFWLDFGLRGGHTGVRKLFGSTVGHLSKLFKFAFLNQSTLTKKAIKN